MISRSHFCGSQGGFVLVSVVGLSALMLILAGVFNFFAEQEVEGAIRSKTLLANKLDQKSTEQTLLYLVATKRFTRAGVSMIEEDERDYVVDGDVDTKPVGGEMRLDGTVYTGFGSTVFYIRDSLGAFGLNSQDGHHLEKLLSLWESDIATRRRLIDSLLDYTDVDRNERLYGSESTTEDAAPKNFLLRTVPEIRRVKGWANWLDRHSEFDPETLFSVNWNAVINLNTLPPGHFKYLGSLSDADLHSLIEYRKEVSFQSADDVLLASGGALSLEESYYRFMPSNKLRFTIVSADSKYSSTMSVNLTPYGSNNPWHVEYQYFSERLRGLSESSDRFRESHFTHLSTPAARGSAPVER